MIILASVLSVGSMGKASVIFFFIFSFSCWLLSTLPVCFGSLYNFNFSYMKHYLIIKEGKKIPILNLPHESPPYNHMLL